METATLPRLVRPTERTKDLVQTAGMAREQALKTEWVWAGVARTNAGMVSGWHHHGGHESVIYVLSGRLKLECGSGGRTVLDAKAGDFIHIPPEHVHRESNPGSTDSEIVVVRAGKGEVTVNVDGPAE